MKISNFFVSIIAIIGFAITSNAQIPSYVPSNGLVGWWPFNGNANDESGNGNNGTANGATLTSDQFGNVNMAYNFDGLDDYIALTSSFFNGSTSVSELSYSVWIKTNQSPNLGLAYAINCKEGFWRSISLNINDEGQFSFGGSQPTVYFGITSPAQIILPNIWNHLVITYTNSIANLYLNGNLVQTAIFSMPSLNYEYLAQGNSTATNYFGAAHPVSPGITNFFNGKIDDFGTWDRALTQCEIQDIYHSQLGSQAISAGLDQSICAGDNITLNASGGNSYQWNNNVVNGAPFTPTQTATYAVNGTDSVGCTGSDTVVVSVLENGASSLTQTALDSYTLNGQTYTQSGTYTQVIPAANGCDSTITLNLTLNFTGIHDLVNSTKILVKITDLNGKTIPRRKNTVMLFIYEDGTVERVVEME